MTAAEQYQTNIDTTRHAATAANTSYDNARQVAQLWRAIRANEALTRAILTPPALKDALDALAESFPQPTQEVR
jgi:hypothetical protein